ncbi:MAG: HAMP domain-containing protein, partial [Burkholderiales bacterium]|nr:HAMP domain-containing protein [Burkholderiales bacterium]
MIATARPGSALARSGIRYLLILCVGFSAVALFMLATASANIALFAEHYPLLLALNGGIALVLVALVLYQLFTLRRKLRAGVFGTKLTLRLVLLFALMAVIPGALIYGVSVQFLAKSIESWFEVRIDRALEGGLNISRNALDNMLRDLTAKADGMALQLATRPPAEHLSALNALREQAGVQEATLFSQRGTIIAYSGSERVGLIPEPPPAAALRQFRLQQTYSAVESVSESGLVFRVLVPVYVLSLAEGARVLQLLQAVPKQLAQDAETVQAGYRDYQELTLSRRGLKRLYGITLTMTLLLALLSSVALAFVLSDRLSAPLGVLVEGTRAVAQGDFSQRAAVASHDELGMLTQSFNSMTVQLAEARSQAERHQEQLSHAKAYLESVLGNLSAGVLAFDNALRLRSANSSAGQILDVDFGALLERDLEQWDVHDRTLNGLARTIREEFGRAQAAEWEQQVEREVKGGVQVLLLRGTRLPQSAEAGCVVVFDDITHLLQAQRDAAWAEVARRLAHEIKNPLTPIQLSAERLAMKLEPKVDGADRETLLRGTRTIVSQVAAMKHMVDDFAIYARQPRPGQLQPVDLPALLLDVLALYDNLRPHVVLNLPSAPVVVQGEPTRLRQVLHNLLQNAVDAQADRPDPSYTIALETADGEARLSVADRGPGFPPEVIDH